MTLLEGVKISDPPTIGDLVRARLESPGKCVCVCVFGTKLDPWDQLWENQRWFNPSLFTAYFGSIPRCFS